MIFYKYFVNELVIRDENYGDSLKISVLWKIILLI